MLKKNFCYFSSLITRIHAQCTWKHSTLCHVRTSHVLFYGMLPYHYVTFYKSHSLLWNIDILSRIQAQCTWNHSTLYVTFLHVTLCFMECCHIISRIHAQCTWKHSTLCHVLFLWNIAISFLAYMHNAHENIQHSMVKSLLCFLLGRWGKEW